MTAESLGDKREWVLSALDRYEVPLLRFAMRLLGHREAARDAVQHAFMQLCDRWPADLDGRLGPWLFTVCRNRAIDVLRTRGRDEPFGHDGDATATSREADPADLAEQDELHWRLREAVSALPDGQREAIGLWSESFGYAEIARITGRTEGNVRVLVHRALKRLRNSPELKECKMQNAKFKMQSSK